jgi:hypothetical protein
VPPQVQLKIVPAGATPSVMPTPILEVTQKERALHNASATEIRTVGLRTRAWHPKSTGAHYAGQHGGARVYSCTLRTTPRGSSQAQAARGACLRHGWAARLLWHLASCRPATCGFDSSSCSPWASRKRPSTSAAHCRLDSKPLSLVTARPPNERELTLPADEGWLILERVISADLESCHCVVIPSLRFRMNPNIARRAATHVLPHAFLNSVCLEGVWQA